MYFFLFLVFLALVAAAIVIRRKVNDPANPFGLWFERTMRPRMVVAAKAVAYLTLAAWVLIFAFAPEDERGGFGDLMKNFRTAIGLEGGLEGEKTSASPADPSSSPPSIPPPIRAPLRIPGPEETSKQVPGRR